MSQSAERIEKFFTDADGIITKAGKAEDPKKGKPLCTELEKLAKWLHKHQDDSVGDGAKDKLLITVQKYYKWMKALETTPEAVKERVADVMEVYLMLPEGKLTTGKTKKQVLKWLEDARGDSEGGKPGASKSRTVEHEVVDAMETRGVLTLTLEGCDTEVDVGDKSLHKDILEAFESGCSVIVAVDENGQFVDYRLEEEGA